MGPWDRSLCSIPARRIAANLCLFAGAQERKKLRARNAIRGIFAANQKLPI